MFIQSYLAKVDKPSTVAWFGKWVRSLPDHTHDMSYWINDHNSVNQPSNLNSYSKYKKYVPYYSGTRFRTK